MINERIRKAIHCIEDSISRFDKKGDRQHYSFNESLYCWSVKEFSIYFQKLLFLENIVKKLDFYYESCGIVKSLNDVLFISNVVDSTGMGKKPNYTILMDRADSFINELFETLPSSVEPKKNNIVMNVKAYLPHIIKIEDYYSFMIYLIEKYKFTKNVEYLQWAQQKTELYTDLLYSKTDRLVLCGMDATKKQAFPSDKYLLSSSGYYLLGLLRFLECSSIGEYAELRYIYAVTCRRLIGLQRTNGYFNVSDDISPVMEKKDSLSTLLIAAAFFGGIRLGLIEDTYYNKAVKAFCVVIDDFKLKDGLLSMPNISNISKIKRYLSINFNLTSTAYSDKESGLAALALASVEYSKCSDNKRLD